MPETCDPKPRFAGGSTSREPLLPARDALVDRAVPADGLAELLRGLLARAPLREPADPGDDVGPDAPGLPVVVGDVGVHDGEAPLGLLVALGGVGDEVALLQDLHDGPVGQLDGPAGVVHEDPLDLAPALLVATPALLRERLHLPLYLPAALPELPLGLLFGAPLLRRPLVLAPELLPGPRPLLLAALCAPAPGDDVDDQQDDDDHDNHDDQYLHYTHYAASLRLPESHHYPKRNFSNALRHAAAPAQGCMIRA